ncbi:hypothetical protein [Escherichia coli]|nr:hypothetical protein [Escherichia coli]
MADLSRFASARRPYPRSRPGKWIQTSGSITGANSWDAACFSSTFDFP